MKCETCSFPLIPSHYPNCYLSAAIIALSFNLPLQRKLLFSLSTPSSPHPLDGRKNNVLTVINPLASEDFHPSRSSFNTYQLVSTNPGVHVWGWVGRWPGDKSDEPGGGESSPPFQFSAQNQGQRIPALTGCTQGSTRAMLLFTATTQHVQVQDIPRV